MNNGKTNGQIESTNGQKQKIRFFENLTNKIRQVRQGRTAQRKYQQRGVGGADRALKAVYCRAYRWEWALKVVAGIADVGEAMIAFNKDALRIIAFDWMGGKVVVYKMLRDELVEYNVDAADRYYAVNAWKLYEAVDKVISSNVRRAYEVDSHVIIGVEDDTGEEATLYVELEDGRREWLKARVVESHRIDPSDKPVVAAWIKTELFMNAMTRARQLGARYVDIEVMPGVIRIESKNNGRKYAAKIKGRIATPLGYKPMKGRYIMNTVYKVVSHSAYFDSTIVQMTRGGLLRFEYIVPGLTVYVMPV